MNARAQTRICGSIEFNWSSMTFYDMKLIVNVICLHGTRSRISHECLFQNIYKYVDWALSWIWFITLNHLVTIGCSKYHFQAVRWWWRQLFWPNVPHQFDSSSLMFPLGIFETNDNLRIHFQQTNKAQAPIKYFPDRCRIMLKSLTVIQVLWWVVVQFRLKKNWPWRLRYAYIDI